MHLKKLIIGDNAQLDTDEELTAICDFCNCCKRFSLSMAITRRRTSSWNCRSLAAFFCCSSCSRNSSCWAELCWQDSEINERIVYHQTVSACYHSLFIIHTN